MLIMRWNGRGCEGLVPEAYAAHILDAGETLAVTNLDIGHAYTFVLLLLDLSAGASGRPDVRNALGFS
jgi:hypothetical protein